MLSGSYSTAILRYPTGRFGIAGSIPVELTKARGGLFPGRDSQVWESEQEVVDALLAIGVEQFQLSDCSWYEPSSKAVLQAVDYMFRVVGASGASWRAALPVAADRYGVLAGELEAEFIKAVELAAESD